MKYRLLAILTLLTSMLALGFDPRISAQDEPRAKVSPWVLDRTSQGEEVEFIVVLGAKADLALVAALPRGASRVRATRDALREVAAREQAGLLAWLSERGIEHRPFYIVNAIWVKARPEVALEIASRPEVARIDANPRIGNLPDDQLQRLKAEALQAAGIEPGISYIRAPEVWAAGHNGAGIVIASADTGVQWDHPALKSHYRGWDGAAASHDYNWHDSIHSGGGICGANAAAPCDDNGHGTHTVGTALGDDGAGNAIGVAPGARFIACRNMDRGNGTPATYIECMEFFLAPYPVNGTPAQGDPSRAPDISINSWSCPPSEGCVPQTLQAAVEAQRAAGIMMVVAAGNSGSNCSTVTDPPSHYEAAYTIGAFSASSGVIAPFSGRGPAAIDGSGRVKPDLTAPGVGIRSSYPTNTYVALNGTSMATPHVAGAIALLWSAQPALRRQIDLTESVLNGAAVAVPTTDCNSSGSPNNVYGHGRLDIKAAVDAAFPSVSPVSAVFAPAGGAGAITVDALPVVNWTATSQASWIVIDGAAGGTGDGMINYTVAANAGDAPRISTLTVAGVMVTVRQEAVTQYSVAGRIVTSAGVGVAQASVSFTRVAGAGRVPIGVVTDAEGRFSQGGFEPNTTYRVTPSKNRIRFTPQSRDFSGPLVTLDFISLDRRLRAPAPTPPVRPGASRRG
jgi:subtilisin family serine protease